MTDEATYTTTRMMLNEYRSAAIYANNAAREWAPYSEIDVDARVYAELGERELSREDNTLLLEDFIAEIRAIATKAPKDSEVVIELGTAGDDDDYHATYEIGYFREPTKEERAEREETNRKIRERDGERAKVAEARERKELERLKAKFGDQFFGHPTFTL